MKLWMNGTKTPGVLSLSLVIPESKHKSLCFLTQIWWCTGSELKVCLIILALYNLRRCLEVSVLSSRTGFVSQNTIKFFNMKHNVESWQLNTRNWSQSSLSSVRQSLCTISPGCNKIYILLCINIPYICHTNLWIKLSSEAPWEDRYKTSLIYGCIRTKLMS